MSTGPLDPTIDGNPLDLTPVEVRNPPVAIIEGSTPELSGEINNLLRHRMRSASLLLFGGFFAFLVKSLFQLKQFQTTMDWSIFCVHVTMTLVTALVAYRLCTNCPRLLRHLRVAELFVFGGSTVFFLMLSEWMLMRSAANGHLTSVSGIWALLIFTYALFIPNTLRRAAVIVGLMAASPIVLMLALSVNSEDFAAVIRSNPDYYGFILEMAMMMTLTAVSAVWGASTIGSLRRKAFELERLGQYRLKQKIGPGGMGEVYLAEHLLLKRPCAIKLIRPDRAGDARALARFEREVRSTARLTHWNTIEIYDYGHTDDGTFYYVMEYLPGLNLGQLVQMCGPIPVGRAIHLVSQTCEALSEAHHQGVIHRDIKPGNIFAARRGGVFDVAKLLDFGLA